MKKIISRKYNKEVYTFYLNEHVNYITKKFEKYISVKTPKNFLGYEGLILLQKKSDIDIKLELQSGKNEVELYQAYSVDRYIPKYILKKIQKKMIYLNNKINTL